MGVRFSDLWFRHKVSSGRNLFFSSVRPCTPPILFPSILSRRRNDKDGVLNFRSCVANNVFCVIGSFWGEGGLL